MKIQVKQLKIVVLLDEKIILKFNVKHVKRKFLLLSTELWNCFRTTLLSTDE